MTDAGSNLAVPRRGDRDAWDALATVLRSGLTFHSCGCSGPGYRPRTRAEVRDRLAVARRQDIPVRDALARPDPWRAPGR
ncbi:hypothetical protein F4561_005954 [Lipingzhangella halophila]|uniref:Uncharacterized protein n=1 Tax=Lipingzhangella halophila TaxID=1783352 RepID=A0A7W7RN42_9ACTN|nr:hypothetical protein [Lipingzhangella halophila]MBB4935060.1 hypothetical protein [Lipingzhangella halophila]